MARGNGLADFKRRLAKVPAAIRRQVDAAHEQNAAEWVKTSRSFAPDDPETGGQDLRTSIRHHRSDTGGQIVQAGGETTTRPSAGGPFDYATAAEWGTMKQAPQPFFWPAYRLLKKRMNSRRRRALNKAIKDANNG